MSTYYYVQGQNLATWSTANSTTTQDDNSTGDTSTGVANTGPGTFVPALLTVFYDNGSQMTISGMQFTGANTPVGSPGTAGTWTLYGSNDHSTWTSITSGTTVITSDSSFHTYTASSLSGTYQYYRLGVQCNAGSGGKSTWNQTDWRLTLSAPAVRRANAIIMIE